MDDPGMFRVSRESMDTLTGEGVGTRHPWMIQGCIIYISNNSGQPAETIQVSDDGGYHLFLVLLL